MTLPLLQTKLYIPPVRPELVSRPRLIERLDDGIDLGRRLTLISAPAGFGKTTLLSEWLQGVETRRTAPLRVAWLSLDEGDNDPARFLAYTIAALQTVGERIGDQLPGMLQSPQSTPLEAFLADLINQVTAVADHFVLVLDDFHLITARSIHDAITFLLDHLPGNMHLVIATRADPPLPVARLRARGQLTELRLPDLRFTSEEAAEFPNRVTGLELAVSEVAALEARTEGWIAGLQMAAVALRATVSQEGDAVSFVQDFTGGHRFVLDYLIEEVLQHQPEPIQAFLLQTSILDRLCGPLCDAVTVEIRDEASEEGREARIPAPDLDSRTILEHLERANLFVVPLDDRREWYRYHRLFADLLRSRLQRVHPHLTPTLHRRASAWYEQSGFTTEAIDHGLAAQNLERVADLIDQSAEATLMRGEAATFLRWVDTLPDELVRARPSLCVLHAWMLLMYGRPLHVVESRLRDADRLDELVTGRVTALHGLMAAFRGQVSQAAELCRCALDQLPEEERFARTYATWILCTCQLVSSGGSIDSHSFDEVLRMSQRAGNLMLSVMVICNRAELLMRQGQLREAAATYQRALALATDARGRRLPIAGQALIGLGELSREWGDLDVAARYLTEGIELTVKWTEVGPFDAYIALTRVSRAQGDLDGAREAIQRAQELAVQFDLTELDDLTVAMFQAWLWVAEGELEAVERWAKGRELLQYLDSPLQEEAGDSYDTRLHKYELLVVARLLIAQDRSNAALVLLHSLVPIAEWRQRPGMLIEIYVLQALALHAQGSLDRAMAALEHAISVAEPEGYVRVFADEGAPMARLLREAAKRGISMEYVGRLQAALGAAAPVLTEEQDVASARAEGRALTEPLSARELEVLRLLDTYLSSTEIAEALYVSVNTVRFHIKNMYGKLGVHRRSDGVEQARELRLL